MSALSWIWDTIVAWVLAAIDAATSTLRSWVNGLIAGARAFAENLVKGAIGIIDNVKAILGAAISSLQGAWNHFVTKTLPDLWAGIQNAVAAASKALTGAIAGVRAWVDNLAGNLQRFFSKAGEDIRSWASGLFSEVPGMINRAILASVPVDFIRDPLGYLEAAFLKFIEPWLVRTLEAFLKGFEEGIRAKKEET